METTSLYGNVWYVDEDQTYGMLKKVDNDGNILWSRRYQNKDFIGSKNFHGIQKIQEMADGSIYTSGTAKFSPGRNHIWIMHLDENGCLGSSDCGEVVITDVEEVEEKDKLEPVVLYPNPTSEIVTIDNLDQQTSYTYRIFNSMGSLISQGNIAHQEIYEIAVSSLSTGLYFLTIVDEQQTSTVLQFAVY